MFRINKIMIKCLMIFSVLYAHSVFAEITISHTQVTDVTPSSFSVIWHANQASLPRIQIFSDAEGTQEITNQFEVVPFPMQGGGSGLLSNYEQAQSQISLKQVAQQKGINKILVRNLQPQITYYFIVYAESDLDSGIWPAVGTSAVTTQKENAFILDGSFLEINVNDADSRGWIVTAGTADATHPVSSFVEAGAEPGKAVINLSNLFDANGVNWYSQLTTSLSIQIIKGNGEIVAETFDINLSSSFAVASNLLFEFASPFDAIIQIASPTQDVYSTGENIVIAWTDSANTLNATISLYMDVDTQGEDGLLITSGIAADPDGVSDQYTWDVSGVGDGSYYVYALMSDGTNTISSYGSAKITIDNNQISSDGDQLSDLWELHYFNSLVQDDSSDSEGDGIPDIMEQFYRTNPNETNAPLQGLTVALKQGANIVGVPGMLIPQLSSYGLLSQLGSTVSSISRYNKTTKLLDKTYWTNGLPAGQEFFLLPGEGYFVQMVSDAEIVLSPFDTNKGIRLTRGENVIAITEPTGNSFGLLDSLGSDVIWSIRRLNPNTSLYETTAFDGTRKVGIPFPLQSREGYIVTVKKDSSIPRQ